MALLAALVSMVALALYHRLMAQPLLLVGVVDLQEVYRSKEAEFTQQLAGAATEAQRTQALAMARHFAQRLPVALDELPRDCACLVVLKGAIAGAPRTLDLTPALRRKLEAP